MTLLLEAVVRASRSLRFHLEKKENDEDMIRMVVVGMIRRPKQTFLHTASTEQIHAIRVYDADMRITRDRWSSFRHNI